MPYVDYTARDWNGIGAALEAYIRQRFPQWTDFNVSNMGNVLKELVQYIADVLHYYLDRQANECFVDTAQERQNLISLCRWLGYKPKGPAAATAELSVTLAAPAVQNVVIPRRTQVKTKDVLEPLIFEFQADCTIPQGQSSSTVTVRHCRTRTQSYEADGSANQQVTLEHTPYLDDSAVVTVNGVTWAPADDFLDARADSQVYVVLVDANSRATVLFGNGTNGACPTGPVEIQYETGGGTIGNVPANHITVIEGVFTDLGGNPVTVTVTNPAQASGGAEAESADEIRWRAPRSLKGQQRTVALEDFRNHAEEVPGIARALAQTRNEDATLPENFTRVYIVPTGGGAPSPTLLLQVDSYLRYEKPIMLTHEIHVVAANYVTVNIAGTIYVRPGYDHGQVQAAAEAALAALFDYTALDDQGQHVVDFGRTVYLSTLIAAIHSVDGVRNVTLTEPVADVPVASNEIAALGTIALTTSA